MGERAERPLDALEAARGRAHDHPAEREQEQQRSDVAEQHVLEHVGGEQVVVAQAVERAGERREQGEDGPGEGGRLERAGAAALRAAALARSSRRTVRNRST